MPLPFKLAVVSVEDTDRTRAVSLTLAAAEEAADRGADLVLLPETPDAIAGQEQGVHVLEDHPVYLALQELAQRRSIGLIATLTNKVDGGKANTGFLLGRDGALVGAYRKKHPAPGEEIVAEPIGSDPFPVFAFEGVRLGLAICMDIHYPEMFRIYGLKGADLVCVSTMYMDYTGDMLESIEKARAIDSQMYLAMSRYITRPYLAGKHSGYAKVIAPDGRIIASTAHRPGVAIAEFDPAWRSDFWNRQYGADLRTIYDASRRPEFYGDLCRAMADWQNEDSYGRTE
jgi:predicted amidohydrolase